MFYGLTKLELRRTYYEFAEIMDKIFNVDETGCTNVHVLQKVMAANKIRRLGAITSREREKNITVVCVMSTSGSYVPPPFIYPR